MSYKPTNLNNHRFYHWYSMRLLSIARTIHSFYNMLNRTF
uniref:Uncharacterized protein n=1 Tax=Arundo donax TaxID=35708 RepID=A0A0A9A5X2_ARUDO